MGGAFHRNSGPENQRDPISLSADVQRVACSVDVFLLVGIRGIANRMDAVGYIDVESPAFLLYIAKYNLRVRVVNVFVYFHIEFLSNHPYCLDG